MMVSNLNEEDIAVIMNTEMDYLDYRCEDGCWKVLVDDHIPMTEDGRSVPDWRPCSVVDVPTTYLLKEWNSLLMELLHKERDYYNLKEAYLLAEQELINTVDFKALYGKNNADVRKQHCKSELSDMVSELKELEWGINWIKGYIPLLKEVIRCK